MRNIKIEEDSLVGLRLDKFLSSTLEDLSRSKVQKLLKNGSILLNSSKAKPKHSLVLGDEIFIKDLDNAEKKLEAEDVDLDIVYEDDSCFVINKVPGVVVYPGGPGQDFTGTVANAIKNKVSDQFNDKVRLGIVHRIDKDTSGLLIIAKTPEAMKTLSAQFKARKVDKAYQALVWGSMEHEEGIIESPIGRNLKDRKKMMITSVSEGKMAISRYKVKEVFELENDKTCSLLDVEIETGRTHQIRVHLTSIGHVVVGDSAYGDRNVNKLFKEKYNLKRQFLHASRLSFKSPATNKTVSLKIDLYKDLEAVIESF